MTYFFYHIPSTGGTSLWRFFNQVYGARHVARLSHVNPDKYWNVGATLPNKLEEYNIVGGHGYPEKFGISSDDLEGCICLFRHPVHRAISEFSRRVQMGKIQLGSGGLLESFEEYVLTRSSRPLRNRYFFPPIDNWRSLSVNEFASELGRSVSLVGLTERMEETLRYFGEALRWHVMPENTHQPWNTRTAREERTGIKVDLSASNEIDLFVRQHLPYEFKMYEAAKLIFERQITQLSKQNQRI